MSYCVYWALEAKICNAAYYHIFNAIIKEMNCELYEYINEYFSKLSSC